MSSRGRHHHDGQDAGSRKGLAQVAAVIVMPESLHGPTPVGVRAPARRHRRRCTGIFAGYSATDEMLKAVDVR